MFEIENIKIDRRDDPCDYIMRMIDDQGKFNMIGSGCYATVYGSKKSDVVYKVGEVCVNSPYLSYVKALRTCRVANPYLPKIHGVRIYSNGCKREDYFVVAIEKLKPLSRKLYNMPYLFERLIYGNLLNDVSDADTSSLGITVVIPKHIRHAIKLLHLARKSAKHSSFDIHDGNFMLRDKQIVITDPLC